MIEPFVSVIIPTYNRESVLLRAVDSVLKQTYQNFELIVVDDASADNTEALVKSIEDTRVKYLRLPHNCGPAKARNEGAKAAVGEYLAFQDSDDYWYPEKLEKQMRFFSENPAYEFAFCKILSKGQEKVLIPPEDSFDCEAYEKGFLDILLISNKIGTPSIVMKRALFRELGGFNEDMKTMEDWELSLRTAERHPIGFVNEILVEATPSQDGINTIRGSDSAMVSLDLLERYWDGHEDKSIFENMVRLVYMDYSLMNKEEAERCMQRLDAIVPRSFGMDLAADYRMKLDQALLEVRVKSEHAEHLALGLANEKKHVTELEESLENEKKHVMELEASLENEKLHVTQLEASLENEKLHVTQLEASLENEKLHVTQLEAVVGNDVLVIQDRDRQIKALKKRLEG